MRARLVAAVLLAIPASALAQEPAQASDAWLPPAVAPSFGIGETLSFNRYGSVDPDSGEREATIAVGIPSLWMGITLYPSPGRWAMFTSFGTEVAFGTYVDEGTRKYTEWTPEVRTGIAHMRKPYDSYFNHVFTDVQLYLIGGWRLESAVQPEGVRIGAGVTAPPLVLLGFAETCFPAPTTLELYADVAEGELPRWGFRMAYQF